ncbi:P-loop containing nucleoside triphosphate hydrolase protein [Irpex rosettiformis]|uniref:P-loop containing nucleoside triphosphate hydrolase protein n=1 Tax=Irpex rosettiformis TaxID=378272 RepID=A0ACB8UGP6_9APHY|nr:P-loop containing nucleoside triphosphate hydrolase protein [Irpex rosettiformis]
MAQVCDEIYAHGVCQRENCPFSHDVYSCDTCRTVFKTAQGYDTHLTSPLHRRKVLRAEKRAAGINVPVNCTVCSLDLATAELYEHHARGKRHVKKLQQLKLETDPGPEEIDVPRDQTRCDVCAINMMTKNFSQHLQGRRHAAAIQFNSLRGTLDDSERDKNGVDVTPDDIDFGFVNEPANINAAWSKKVAVQNTNVTGIRIVNARLSSQLTSRADASGFALKRTVLPITIQRNQQIAFTVTFRPEGNNGRYEDRIEFIFEDSRLNKRFAITRPMVAMVGVKEDFELLKATRPYVRPKRSEQLEEPIAKVTPGVPPPAIAEFKWAVRLLPYVAPKSLKKVLDESESTNLSPSKIAARIRAAFIPNQLSADTYARHFAYMLWIEEERAKRDLSQYDMNDVTMDPQGSGPFYSLVIAGLAEKRPSLIVTDRIFVKDYGSTVNHWFEGHVHEVRMDSVVLRFSPKFNGVRNQRYHVRFDLNRLVYRRMHQGLNTAFTEARVLFPAENHLQNLSAPSAATMEQLKCTDRKIEQNQPQLEAVAAIVTRPEGSVPFVVFGPPGTGKTVTIVEAIRQLIQTKPTTRILACAPSNSAADLIAERLSDLGKLKVFRLNAHSRGVNNVPRPILALSQTTKDGGFDRFVVPPTEDLMKFRVIVCTCLSASLPHGVGFPRGHFSHIFTDEAGQATEPEVMISVKTMADPKTNVVLSGDSKQLGPIVRSPIARDIGLSQSYLDRLMANPIYDEAEGRGITISKLIKNWRSHPAILKFPNDEFYRGDLVACGDPTVTECLARWDHLVKKNFPVIFHGIKGKDEREASSPSFFNIPEASEVKKYIDKLLEDRKLPLKPEQIGVISPYHAQVQKIRKLLKKKEIKVGSVEEYQGQEKRVIIISTVRSSMENVKFDLRHTLGFVANPRRFNVAVTRAQALLIIIGDPTVLSLDPLWRSFINYVSINGGCTGKRIDWGPHEEVDRNGRYDVLRRTEALTALDELIARTKEEILEQTEDLGGHEADTLEGNVEQPWREDE